MAIRKPSENKSTARSNTGSTSGNVARDRADGFLNIAVVDKNGETHRLQVGIPLNVQRKLDRSILNAAKENPDMELSVKASVWIAPSEEEEQQDIPLI